METLRDWSAKRAGCGISITHSTGKITGVAEITVLAGKVLAIVSADRYFELEIPAGESPVGAALARMQRPDAAFYAGDARV